MKTIETFDDVVHVLGGVTGVARITGRSLTSVCNWRRRGALFPAQLYLLMKAALDERGVHAPPTLWRFKRAHPLARAA